MKYLALILAFALTGCATADYDSYAKAQINVAIAKSNAETARYQALSKIAETGTDTSKIAAVMALALGNQSTNAQAPALQAPQASQALQWASILVPSITNLASINANMRIGLANSETSARIAESTNSTFLGVASKIQAPAAAAANITTTTTTTDNHAVDSHAVATTSTTTSAANPTTTSIGGNGVLGSGTFTTNANPITTTTTANPVTTTTTANPVTTTTTNPATTGVVCGVSATGTVNCVP